MSPQTELIYQKLAAILRYIHAHLDEDLKVTTLAEMADLSPPHFHRLFKKFTSLSPHRYILIQRIERSKKLLQNSDLELSEIALKCGFYDQSHFNFQFRNFTGMTPKDYKADL